MRQTLEHDIDYNDGGLKTKHVVIKFVSNAQQMRLGKLQSEIYHIHSLSSDIMVKSERVKSLLRDYKVENSGVIDGLNDEISALSKQIKDFDSAKFFKERIDLVIEILKNNNCDDHLLLSNDFWLNMVDPIEINLFWQLIYLKDQDDSTKKKLILI